MSAARLDLTSWIRTFRCSQRVQLATAFLLGAATTLVGQTAWQILFVGHAPAVISTGESGASRRGIAPLDLNAASAEELQHLPGVGAGLASRIVAHRDRRGGFDSVEELLDVPGLGPRLLDGLRPHVRVAGRKVETVPAAPDDPVAHERERIPLIEPHSARLRKLGDSEKAVLDLNQAGIEELQRLPGIGPTLASRIVADRAAQGPFRSVGDLLRVRGIGPKTLEKLRPHVRVGTDFADNRSTPVRDTPPR